MICGLLAFMLVLSGSLLWRLSAGPMSLDFLTPYLEDALTASLPGRRVTVAETVLVWDMQRYSLDLRAHAVTIRDHQGTVIAALPAVDVGLGLRALLHGTVAVTTLNLERARVTLIRAMDGAILFGTRAVDTPQEQHQAAATDEKRTDGAGRAQIVSDILADLMAEPSPERSLTALHKVRLVNGALTVQDEQLGVVWEAPQADMTLHRNRDGLRAQLSAIAMLPEARLTIAAKVSYERATEQIRLEASFVNLQPSKLATAVPKLHALVGLDLPVNGTLRLALDVQGTLQDLRFELSGGPGMLSHPRLLPQPQPVTAVTARGHLDGEQGHLQLDDVTLTLRSAIDTTLSMHGTAEGVWPDAMNPDLTAQLLVTLIVQNTRTTFDTALSYMSSTERLSLTTSFTHLWLPGFASTVPSLGNLAGLDMACNGKVTLTSDPQHSWPDVSFTISSGPGHLSYPHVLPEPLAVAQVTASGRLHGPGLQLDQARIRLGRDNGPGPMLTVSGQATGFGSDVTITGQAQLESLPIATLRSYWPITAGRKARAWLTKNLVAGTVTQATANFRLLLPGGVSGAATVERLDGTLRYDNLQVHYLRPLPPVSGVTGSGSFDLQGFLLRIDSGTTANQSIPSGEVKITGLDRNRDAIAIQVGLTGPLRDVLTVLNHPHLHLLSGLGLDPAWISGQSDMQALFRFALIGAITLDTVDIKAEGNLKEVSIQNIVLGHSAEHGQLSLMLDKQGMYLKGPIAVAAIPLTLRWQEAFTKEAAWRRTIHAVAPRISHSDLAMFGLDLTDYVTGPFAADVKLTGEWTGKSRVQTLLDLQATRLTLPWLHWQKGAGEAGQARGTLQLQNDRPVLLGPFTLTAGTLTAHGTARFNQAGSDIISLELAEFAFDQSHLSKIEVQRQSGSMYVSVGAGELDLQPFIQHLRDEGGMGGESSVHVHAPALRQVSFGPGRYLEDVQVDISHGKTGWEFIDVAGQIPVGLVQPTKAERQAIEEGEKLSERAFSVKYHPTPQGTYALSVRSNDIGTLLRIFNISDNITSGRLELKGHTTGPGSNGPLQASVEAKRFVVQDAPALAQILAAASLPGLLNMLSSDGLIFSRLAADMTWQGNTMKVEDLHAHGGSLGLTANGDVDIDTDNLNLKGTIIPAYGINSLLGKIPVLNLLVGGKHQGIVAVNYRLTGQLDNPQVVVNPASALTPGFLRRVFDLFDDNGGENHENPANATPPEITEP
jgi:hypothetical protein